MYCSTEGRSIHGSSRLEANIDLLADRFHVFTQTPRGHGHTPDVEGPFIHELMAQDTIAFLETPTHLAGHGEGVLRVLAACCVVALLAGRGGQPVSHEGNTDAPPALGRTARPDRRRCQMAHP